MERKATYKSLPRKTWFRFVGSDVNCQKDSDLFYYNDRDGMEHEFYMPWLNVVVLDDSVQYRKRHQ